MIPYSRHTAIIYIESGGSNVNGEWVEGSKSELTIQGRYVPGNNGNQVVKNSNGDGVVYKGRFITESPVIGNAMRLKVESKGVESVIVTCYAYDTHSVIYI